MEPYEDNQRGSCDEDADQGSEDGHDSLSDSMFLSLTEASGRPGAPLARSDPSLHAHEPLAHRMFCHAAERPTSP